MAQKNINIGSADYAGDGESLRSAFSKIEDNFTENYTSITSINGSIVTINNDVSALQTTTSGHTQDITNLQTQVTALGGGPGSSIDADLNGSVFGDDSTLLVDGTNSTIIADALTGTLPAIDGSQLLSVDAQFLDSQPGAFYLDYNNFVNTPAANAANTLPDGSTHSIDVVAADSTLLVDSVNGTLNATTLTGDLPALDGSALTGVEANTTVFTARADVNLLRGEVVYLTGISGNTPTIDKARANSASTMPAFGIVKADVTANNDVEIVTFGSCPGHDAANFAETGITFALGDTVYVSATEAGKLTNVAPAGESNLIQNIGKIERATPTTNMTIKVGGAGRTNATPALDQGNIFIGNAQNRSSTMSFATAMSTYGGALTGDVTGSVFADDSTVLVDGVNGTVNISNQSINALSDVDTTTIAPSRSMQPLIWDDIDQNWYPGNGISLTSILTMEDNSFIMLRENAYLNFEGSSTDAFDTKLDVVNPTANRTVRLPDADGTIALTNQLNGVTTGQYTGDVTGSVFADDSTVLVDGVNGTLNSSALTMPISIPDGTISSNYLGFGDDDDLKIFHNGSSSIITETNLTSSLIIRSYQDVRLADAGGSETMLKAISHGAVELYHNNVKKLETSADGVAVTGKITGLTDPTAAQDAATKAYVDANSGGGGGSGLQSRGTVTGTTSSLADAAEADLDITGFKSYALLSITTDRAARVRLYVTDATRTADASRAEGVDPTSDAGLIAEVITTGAETVIISPGAYGFNLEGTPTTTIPCRVTNKSGGTSTVQVDLNIVQLEA